mmetsp:Transcript_52485/g.135895  ORF Transcript_52485/g.135895 Transcript_52485/m.135895 type:complete len:197 (-) Transcript_52485:283-873(-)
MPLSARPARATMVRHREPLHEMNDRLCSFAMISMVATFRMDAHGLGESVVKLHRDEGLCKYARDLDKLTDKMGNLLLAGAFMCDEEIWSQTFDNYEEYRSSRVSEYFARMIGLLSEHRVRVSPSIWSLTTAFALIEGSVAELGYGVNVLRAATPYLFRGWQHLPERLRSWVRLDASERETREGDDGPPPGAPARDE